MTKPLELTIYPRMPRPRSTPPSYKWALERGRELDLAHAKRLTDAELAAEWHRHTHTFDMLAEGYRVESFGTDCIQGGHHEARVLHQQETLHRFATAPHYFEEQG